MTPPSKLSGNGPVIHTIGFTGKPGSRFFELLRQAGASRVIDVRLNNTSQLSGFAKRDDLRYFLKEILGIEYVHEPLLAPEKAMFTSYKHQRGDWKTYQRGYLALMKKREIEKRLDPSIITGGCLLYSENQPHFCHRRLVAEYLRDEWGHCFINHLV
jgi:uncharacterized protein (DUF488 family)